MTKQIRKVAAFDFDGTLARGDSLIPFLMRLLGTKSVARSLIRFAPDFIKVGLGQANRDATKERFLAHTLTGLSTDDLLSVGKEYAEWLLSKRLFPKVVNRLDWHRQLEHELVMVSATLDVYLTPLAEQLGFDTLICTKLEMADGYATGKLVGANVRALEKARLLKKHLNHEQVELWAYGNSSSDNEMLAMANYAFMVNRTGSYSIISEVSRPAGFQLGGWND